MEDNIPTVKQIMQAIKRVDDPMLYDIAALIRREILKRNEVRPSDGRKKPIVIHAD